MAEDLAYDVSSITVASNEAEQQRPAMAAPIPPVGHVTIVMPDTCVGKTVLLPKSEFNCATCLRHTNDKINRAIRCCAAISLRAFVVLVVFTFYFGFSVASIVIGALNNGSDSSLLELNTWPHCTSAQWLIVSGIVGIIMVFVQEHDVQKRNQRPLIINMIYWILTIFGLFWFIIGANMIFTNGYDTQYFTYTIYVMMCISVYITLIVIGLMFLMMFCLCFLASV